MPGLDEGRSEAAWELHVPTKTTDWEVASSSGWGGIDLHGRLIAQGLHYAFPHDCPYPAKSGSLNPLTATQWQEETTKEGWNANDWSKAKASRGDQLRLYMLAEVVEEIITDYPSPLGLRRKQMIDHPDCSIVQPMSGNTGLLTALKPQLENYIGQWHTALLLRIRRC